MIRLVLAWLWHRPVQVLAVLGVAIGLAALLFPLSVMNGLIAQDRAAVRGTLSDLLLIPAPGAQPARFEPYRAALAGVGVIEACAPHLIVYAVRVTDDSSGSLASTQASDLNGVQLVGIDPEAELAATDFGAYLARARLAPVADPLRPFAVADDVFGRPGALVSDSLAAVGRLGFRVGQRFEVGTLPPVLPPPGEPLEPNNFSFTLAGTYAPDEYHLGMDRIYVQREGRDGLHFNLLGPEAPDFTEILIRLRPGVSYADGKSAVLAALQRAGLPAPGGDAGGALETWEERRAVFLRGIMMERRIFTLVLFFIVVVAAFGLFATLSALVREKVRELGILAALGYTPLQRGALLLGAGAAGSAAGALLGYLAAYGLVSQHRAFEGLLERLGIVIFPKDLYVVQGLPALWLPGQAAFLALLAFLTGLLFTLLPAVRAATLAPVEALRYE
ncbi:MAG: FtsX-like permease family protein [Planctomycetota bacterium]|nr:MAG: FtsX-like permease family protein [Planctomycetota bacterium]